MANGDILISSANDITTYSNSFKFIRKWADHENIGYIEAITQFNDSSYIIKNMPIQGQSRYRIINPKSGNLINSYDSIEKANKYISSYTNSFERFEGHILSHGYQGNEILECTMDSTKIRYRKISTIKFLQRDVGHKTERIMSNSNGGDRERIHRAYPGLRGIKGNNITLLQGKKG